MKNLTEFLIHAESLVKDQIRQIKDGSFSLITAEQGILDLIYTAGSLMESMILEGIEEPTMENRILINGEKARYKGDSNLTFTDRFGHQQTIRRRSYSIATEKGYVYPLDHKLGMENRRCYSPLLSFLIGSYGANESYDCASKLLSDSLGFSISTTAIQKNAESIGHALPDNPLLSIPDDKLRKDIDLMIVESDGTMSPQIPQIEGLSGRESLKVPTEYKECNVVAIERYLAGNKLDRWVGADYGKRSLFEEYFRRSALKMGVLNTKTVVYIADGARHNWEMCKTHLPGAIEILDAYHALEHLASFCSYLDMPESDRQEYFQQWREMVLEGDNLQVIEEMKRAQAHIANKDEAQKEINYLVTNKDRMAYDEYKRNGWPIGSGLVEGQCKLVVNKRFKRNGMRWKLKDNRAILKLRLAFMNDTLRDHFKPKPFKWEFWDNVA